MKPEVLRYGQGSPQGIPLCGRRKRETAAAMNMIHACMVLLQPDSRLKRQPDATTSTLSPQEDTRLGLSFTREAKIRPPPFGGVPKSRPIELSSAESRPSVRCEGPSANSHPTAFPEHTQQARSWEVARVVAGACLPDQRNQRKGWKPHGSKWHLEGPHSLTHFQISGCQLQ